MSKGDSGETLQALADAGMGGVPVPEAIAELSREAALASTNESAARKELRDYVAKHNAWTVERGAAVVAIDDLAALLKTEKASHSALKGRHTRLTKERDSLGQHLASAEATLAEARGNTDAQAQIDRVTADKADLILEKRSAERKVQVLSMEVDACLIVIKALMTREHRTA